MKKKYTEKSQRKNCSYQTHAGSNGVSCDAASPTVGSINCKLTLVEGRHVKLHLKDDKWNQL
jgi:hypothetical protein